MHMHMHNDSPNIADCSTFMKPMSTLEPNCVERADSFVSALNKDSHHLRCYHLYPVTTGWSRQKYHQVIHLYRELAHVCVYKYYIYNMPWELIPIPTLHVAYRACRSPLPTATEISPSPNAHLAFHPQRAFMNKLRFGSQVRAWQWHNALALRPSCANTSPRCVC